MPLHKHVSIRDELLDSVYAGKDLLTTLPSNRFPAGEMRPDDAFQAISDELLLDGNARQNLATFCQTWEEEEVHKLMDLAINKNMIDKDEYPQTAELERRCVNILSNLWNAPRRRRVPQPAAPPPGRARPACSAGWRCQMAVAGPKREAAGLDDRPGRTW